MQVVFRKRTDGGSSATIERADGVRLRLWSYDRTSEVPHDAVHLIGEQALGLPYGLWGSIASGALFDSLEVLAGRQRHDRQRRSDEVRRRNAEQLRMAEAIVGVLQQCIDSDGVTVKRELDRAWGVTEVGASPFSPDQGAAAVAELRVLRSRWQTITGDETVSFVWRSPRKGSSSDRKAGRYR